jgi:hypothetical protein
MSQINLDTAVTANDAPSTAPTLAPVLLSPQRALQIARDAYRGSTDYFNANIRPQIEKDLRAFQGKHNPDSKYLSENYKGRAKFYRPKTRSAIRKNEAIAAEAFFSTLDTVSVTAQNERDKVQQTSAEVMGALLEYRLQKSIPWFQTVIGAYQDAQTVGVVASYQHWEYNPAKKIDKPVIELLPLENLRFDPACSWIDPVNTSPYVVRLIPMYVRDVKAKMRPVTRNPWAAMSDAQILSAMRNYDSTRLLREDNRTDSRDRITAITEFTVVWVHQNVVDIDGVDLMWYTLGSEFLLTMPQPLEEVYAHGKRPFTVGYAILETHKPYPSSLPKLTRDTQSEINEVANSRIDNVKFAMNKRYFVKRNKQVDIRSLTRNIPGSVTLLTDVEGDVKVVDTPDVTASAYQEQDRLNSDFDDVVGTFSNSSVDSNRRLSETVGGMELLSDNSNKVANYQLKTFVETWVEPTLRQLMLLEQFYETDETILALAADKAQLFQKHGMLGVTDEMLLSEFSLTCNIGTGATSPAQKINNFTAGVNGVKNALADGVLERYGVDPTEVIKEVFGALGHKDGGRFFKPSEDQDPRIAAMQQQIQQLQQQLEAKMPQAIVDATVRKLDAETDLLGHQGKMAEANKVKLGVDSTYAAMQAAEVIAQVPQVAAVADKVMQVAGYITPDPVGMDPNFPVAQAAEEAPPPEDVPSGAGQGDMNTSPMSPPLPPSANVGARAGIETQRADGA